MYYKNWAKLFSSNWAGEGCIYRENYESWNEIKFMFYVNPDVMYIVIRSFASGFYAVKKILLDWVCPVLHAFTLHFICSYALSPMHLFILLVRSFICSFARSLFVQSLVCFLFVYSLVCFLFLLSHSFPFSFFFFTHSFPLSFSYPFISFLFHSLCFSHPFAVSVIHSLVRFHSFFGSLALFFKFLQSIFHCIFHPFFKFFFYFLSPKGRSLFSWFVDMPFRSPLRRFLVSWPPLPLPYPLPLNFFLFFCPSVLSSYLLFFRVELAKERITFQSFKRMFYWKIFL